MMTYLKTCPECKHPAQQKVQPRGFVCCGNKACPVHRLRIPLPAWQGWPRETAVTAVKYTSNEKQRAEEIQRLQDRLATFGDVERQNTALARDAAVARDALRNAEQQLKSKTNALYEAQQRITKITADRDTKQLELKKIQDWAIQGAQVSWAAANDRDARIYEWLLELLGKRDATEVPCETCQKRPVVHQYPDKPEELHCSCFKGTRNQWLQRQRRVKESRATPIATKTFDRNKYGNNIARARREIPSVAADLVADQNEILLYLVERLSAK